MVGGLQAGKSRAGAGGGLLIQASALLGGSFWEQSCFSPSSGSHSWGVWGCSSTHLGSPIWEIWGCFATDLRSPLFGGCGALYPPIRGPHILGALSLGFPRPYSRGLHLTAFCRITRFPLEQPFCCFLDPNKPPCSCQPYKSWENGDISATATTSHHCPLPQCHQGCPRGDISPGGAFSSTATLF